MIIKKLHIDNFGKFENYDLELDKDFNVIYGKNEDGKSTLMAFILMMFYGHKGRSTDITKNPRRKYTPWNSKNMKGYILFEYDNKNYRLERTFGASNTTDEVNIWNDDTGEKIKIKNIKEPGQEFFGLGEEAFSKSVFIGQNSSIVNSDGKKDEITQKLLNLVTSGSEDVSYKKAKETLDNSLESLISKRKTKGLLVESKKMLENLEDMKVQAQTDEEDKENYNKQINELKKEKVNLVKQKNENLEMLNIYELFNTKKEYEEALKREEGLNNLSNKIENTEKKLKIDTGYIDEKFIKECENYYGKYNELIDRYKEEKSRIDNLTKEISSIEDNKPKEVSKDTLKKMRGNNIKQKELKKQIDYLEKKQKLNKIESKLKDMNTEFEETQKAVEESEKNYKSVQDKKESIQKDINSNDRELNRVTDELELLNKRYEEVKEDVNNRIKEAKGELEEAKKPQEIEVPGGWEINKLMLGLLVVSAFSFIVLGTLVNPILFAGLIISVILTYFSFSKSEKKTIVKDFANEELVKRKEDKYENEKDKGEKRIREIKNSIKEADEKIDKLKDEKTELEDNSRKINEKWKIAKNKVDDMKNKLGEIKVTIASIESSRKSAKEVYENARAELDDELEENTDNLDIDELTESLEQLTGIYSKTLKEYNCETLDEFNELFHKYTNYIDSLKSKNKELSKIEEENEAREEKVEGIKETILDLICKYKKIEDIDEVQNIIDELKIMLKDLNNIKIELKSAMNHRQDIEKENSIEEIKVKIKDMENKIQSMDYSSDIDFSDEDKLDEMDDKVIQLQNQISDIEKIIASKESEVKEKYRNRLNVSQVDEEIEKVRGIIDLQESDYEALKIAKKNMEESFEEIQKNFGPMVNEKTAYILEKLTDGKYNNVRIARDFSINVEDSNVKTLHEWGFLSDGTIDQAYLALRLAVFDLVIYKDEKIPLFLDDTFTQYDDIRGYKGLKFIKEYYSYNDSIQVIMFTCHNRITRWAKEIENVSIQELS